MKEAPLSILIIPMKQYPCTHAMLESVYTRSLPSLGYQVTWLMLSNQVQQPTRERWNGTTVYLFPAPVNRGIRAYLVRIFNWFRLLIFAILLTFRDPFDIIQVRNSLTGGVTAWLIACFLPARFVYQFSYPIPEELIQAAYQKRTRLPWLQKWHGRAQIKLRTWVLRRADLVLAISAQMRKEILAHGVADDKVMSFPLGTDNPPEPDAEIVANLRAQLGLNKKQPVIMYFGTIKPERQLGFLASVAAIVAEKCPTTAWLIVGDGPDVELKRLKTLFESVGLKDKSHFTGRVPRIQIPSYLALATLTVSPIPPTPLFWISSPTKTVESLASGCPVVGTNIPDQETVITESEGGLVVPYDAEQFASAIVTILANPARAKMMAKAGRAYVRKYRSYDVLAAEIDRRYHSLLFEHAVRTKRVEETEQTLKK